MSPGYAAQGAMTFRDTPHYEEEEDEYREEV
jgi:hypothetical protein